MRSVRKIIKYAAFVITLVLLLDVATVLLVAHWRPAIHKADAIIVLGAAINTPALYNRTLTGLRVYEQGNADVIVLSGGRISDKDISEAGYMQKVIKQNSSDNVPVIIEDQSHNTEENIRNARAKLPNAKSVIIVSDEFHLARAVAIAYRNGFYPVYWTSPKPVYFRQGELNRLYAREMVAMIAYIPKFVLNK